MSISACYYSELRNVILIFNEIVEFYQAKSLMLNNIWKTYWTFVSKKWTHESYVIALCNSE